MQALKHDTRITSAGKAAAMRTKDRKPRFHVVGNPDFQLSPGTMRRLTTEELQQWHGIPDALGYTRGPADLTDDLWKKNPPILHAHHQRTWSQGNGRIRRALCYIGAAAVLFALIIGFMLLAVDAIDKEAAWREERLCRIYGVCNPNAGP